MGSDAEVRTCCRSLGGDAEVVLCSSARDEAREGFLDGGEEGQWSVQLTASSRDMGHSTRCTHAVVSGGVLVVCHRRAVVGRGWEEGDRRGSSLESRVDGPHLVSFPFE